ncbi:MAG TPA: aminoglycoside phosphotransferase family protein [Chloroflexota bacterium]|nr:aminoglycoside phosphotransferase family protein [Chloroflexota bacterium]
MVATLLRLINEQHGTAFELRGRYPVGEQGAFALSGSEVDHGQRFVLKWSHGVAIPDELRQAVSVTQRLRAVGYPAPRYRLVGVAPTLEAVYSVQEELPGTPLGGRLDRPLLGRLLEMNALQRGQAVVPTEAWPRPIADPVLRGGDGYCLLDPLRSYSRATATLLGVLQRLAAADDEHPPAGDVVHFDFQGSNILIAGGEISGVVDWEGCCAGDRAFDLATLFFYAGESGNAEADQVERLWRLLLERTGPQLLGVYLAHLVLRQVDWSIRFHDRAAVERWLGRADDVLRRLSAAIEGDAGD